MKKFIYNGLTKTVLICTAAFTLLTSCCALFILNGADVFKTVPLFAYGALLLLCIVLTAFSLALFRFIDHANPKTTAVLKGVFTAVLLIGQCFILFSFDINQITDPYMINDRALELANGTVHSIDENSVYFSIYSNNNLVCLAVALFFKILMKVGIDASSNLPLAVLNALLIDVSVFFLYKTAKRIKGEAAGLKTLYFCVLNPLHYLLINWTYTLTYSLPVMAAITYLAVAALGKNTPNKKKLLFAVLIGLLSTLGYFLRPTAMFPMLAFLAVCAIAVFGKKSPGKWHYLCVCVVLVSFAASFFAGNALIKTQVDNSERNFPLTHWIMIGLQSGGRVNGKDILYTNSFANSEEMKEANILKIKESFREKGAVGLLIHGIRKTVITWSNGISSYYGRMISDRSPGRAYNYIVGEKRDFTVLYCQAFRVMLLVLAFLLIVQKLRHNGVSRFDLLFLITILGGFAFYLIWEAKDVYSAPFFMMFMLFIAINARSVSFRRLNDGIGFPLLRAGAFCLAIVVLAAGYTTLTQKPFSSKQYAVTTEFNPFFLYTERVSDISKQNRTLSQEFTADKAFTDIQMCCTKMQGDANCRYRITVKDVSNDRLVYSRTHRAEDINNFVLTLKMPETVNPNGEKGKYVITVTAETAGRSDTMQWVYFLSKFSDLYAGDGYLDGKHNPDLQLSVFQSGQACYMSKLSYAFFSLVTLASVFVSTQMFENAYIKGKKRKSRSSIQRNA